MFTGIIAETGVVAARSKSRLSIRASNTLIRKLKRGTSVALDGTCLTVVAKNKHVFAADVMPETARRTTLSSLRTGTRVNLELPATPSTLLSGHLVQGHVDGTARLMRIAKKKDVHILQFSIARTLAPYIVEKGSIAVNGISLTVIQRSASHFTVGIVPHTRRTTSLHALKAGNFVNIEVDMIAKYVERFIKKKKRI